MDFSMIIATNYRERERGARVEADSDLVLVLQKHWI